jgi:hypothetical protein
MAQVAQETLAEAIADGLTKLDEMKAFYGVLDLPEDTYNQLTEEHDEDDLSVLSESFVVRKVDKSMNHPQRTMISAAAVLSRAAELAKEAGEKKSFNFIKAAHADLASKMKAESVEEFIQYEDAVTEALQAIKEDCRIEALVMSDSLLEAYQLANELFEDLVQEYLSLDEAIYADDYNATSEPSQFAGFLPKVVHKSKGTTMFRGQHGYKTKTAAASGAKAYLDAYAKMGDTAATRAVHAHHANHPESLKEEVLDEATRPLSGDAYWKAKEVESKEEYLKAQRKALGLPEPVKRGRGKPTNIDRDLLKTRAHSNVEAGKRPTAGFDRNEKIHFVRHLKNHPDFADHHVSQAGRPVGTTKVAKQQQDLVKKKQDTAFSMWAGLGKK